MKKKLGLKVVLTPFKYKTLHTYLYDTVVQVTIRVGTLGYDLGPAICDTCQKAS